MVIRRIIKKRTKKEGSGLKTLTNPKKKKLKAFLVTKGTFFHLKETSFLNF